MKKPYINQYDRTLINEGSTTGAIIRLVHAATKVSSVINKSLIRLFCNHKWNEFMFIYQHEDSYRICRCKKCLKLKTEKFFI